MIDLQSVIERLTAIYGEPRTENPELFLIEFERAMSGTSITLLNRAIDEGIRTWRFFPRPSEVIEIVHSQNPPQTVPEQLKDWEKNWAPPTPEARARVKAMADKLIADLKSSDPIANAEARAAFKRTQCAPGDAIRASLKMMGHLQGRAPFDPDEKF